MKKSRVFLMFVGLALLSLIAVACSPEPQVIEVTVETVREVEVEKEVVVEKEVEVIVEKEVTVEVVRIEEVEKEVVITVEVEVEADYVPEGTLDQAAGVNHLTWDPHNDQRTISLQYLNPIFEGLLREATDGRSFIPELATSWEEDDTGVTFKLREGVTFSDGTPFNAEVAVMNFDRVKEVGHPVNKGFIRAIESAEALDDMTVRYNYSQFDGTALLTLSRFAGKMIAPSAFDNIADGNPIGTGPYIYNADESAADNTFKVYDYNPNYWNNNAQPVARIEITTVLNGATALNGLINGDFHTAGVVAIPLIAQAEAEGLVISAQPAVAWGPHVLDRTGSIVPELADEKVRQAMSYALDREAFFSVVNFGQPTAQHALPGGYAYSEDAVDLSFDMDKAMALMAEAGNPEFEINVPTFGAFNARNAFLASSWAPLGITVNAIEINNIFAACFQNEGAFPVAICPINERHIKHFVENRLLEGGSLNPFGHVDAEIEAIYADIASLPLDEAEAGYAEIARISAEKAYIMHLGWAAVPIGSNPDRISGVDVRFIYPGTYYHGNISLNE